MFQIGGRRMQIAIEESVISYGLDRRWD
jgi:hypothetical protein